MILADQSDEDPAALVEVGDGEVEVAVRVTFWKMPAQNLLWKHQLGKTQRYKIDFNLFTFTSMLCFQLAWVMVLKHKIRDLQIAAQV